MLALLVGGTLAIFLAACDPAGLGTPALFWHPLAGSHVSAATVPDRPSEAIAASAARTSGAPPSGSFQCPMVTDVPLPAPVPTAPAVPPGRQALKVPILMYHYIRVNPNPRDALGADLSVSPSDFAREMDWIAGNGYHPVDFNDLRAYYAGRAPLPSRPVILTFDDGYNDLYTAAFPVLKQHRFKAVAYIVSGFLGRPDNVTREQVLEMDRAGIEIASHTVDHVDLTRVAAAQLTHQVADAKTALEQLVGHPVVDFCYPSGQFSPSVVAAVQAAGYDTATTTQPGSVHSLSDRYTWTRVRVHGVEPLDVFASFMAAEEPPPGAALTPIPLLPAPPPAPSKPHLPDWWPKAPRQDLVMDAPLVRPRPEVP